MLVAVGVYPSKETPFGRTLDSKCGLGSQCFWSVKTRLGQPIAICFSFKTSVAGILVYGGRDITYSGGTGDFESSNVFNDVWILILASTVSRYNFGTWIKVNVSQRLYCMLCRLIGADAHSLIDNGPIAC